MYFEASAATGRGVAESFSMIANVCAQSEFPEQPKRRVVNKPVRYVFGLDGDFFII
jgi:hypothetical protein